MRQYTPIVSDFDDGSQVEGVVWSSFVGKYVAVGLAGAGTLLSNNGNNLASISTDGITWSFSGLLQFPFPPAEIADVIYSTTDLRYYSAGYASPATAFGEWLSNLGVNWSRISRGTTATFECSICNVSVGPGAGTFIVGGQLNSGTGKLIGRTVAGVFSAVSTPIDDQPFRVSQIAYDTLNFALIATLVPVGVVSVSQRVMRSFDAGVTWTLRSTPLDNLAAYGVCQSIIPGPDTVMVITGQTKAITTNDGATTFVDVGTIPGGVHCAGKPVADSNGVCYLPGGDTNDLTELTPQFGPWTYASTTLPGMTYAKAAGYSSSLDQVVVGGLGSPASALYRSYVPVTPTNISLTADFEL